MDAETRHQLKQNELGEALKKLNDPWVGYSLVVVILFFAGWFGYKYVQEQRELSVANAWRTVMEANPTDPTNGAANLNLLQGVASGGPNANVEAAAQLRIGLAKRIEGRQGNPEALREALTQLMSLGNSATANSSLRAAALFAAGLTHEDLRENDKAQGLYERLRDDAGFKGSPFIEMATERLTTLEEMGEPVQFTAGRKADTIDLDTVLGPVTPTDDAAPATPSAPADLAELVEGMAGDGGEESTEDPAETPAETPEEDPGATPTEDPDGTSTEPTDEP